MGKIESSRVNEDEKRGGERERERREKSHWRSGKIYSERISLRVEHSIILLEQKKKKMKRFSSEEGLRNNPKGSLGVTKEVVVSRRGEGGGRKEEV